MSKADERFLAASTDPNSRRQGIERLRRWRQLNWVSFLGLVMVAAYLRDTDNIAVLIGIAGMSIICLVSAVSHDLTIKMLLLAGKQQGSIQQKNPELSPAAVAPDEA
jgi:hypothetical protein